MKRTIRITVLDSEISRIGIDNEWITFKIDNGDIIELEKTTLKRGLACYSASQQTVEADGLAKCQCDEPDISEFYKIKHCFKCNKPPAA